MSHQLQCPNGHNLTILPVMEGKWVKCPACQTILEVPIMTAVEDEPNEPPPLPREAIRKGPPVRDRAGDDEAEEDAPRRRRSRRDEKEEDDWDEPRPSRGRRYDNDDDDAEKPSRKARKNLRRAQMRATRLGLRLFYWKFNLYLALVFAFIAVAWTGLGTRRAGIGGGLAWLLMISVMLTNYLIAPALGIVGASFMVRVPPQTRARNLAVCTLVLEAVPPVCGLLAKVFGAASFNDPEVIRLAVTFNLLASLAMLAGFIVFTLFLRRIALHYGDKGTAKAAMSSMITFVGALIGGPIVMSATSFILIMLGMRGTVLLGIVLLGMVVAWIVIMVKQLIGMLAVIATVHSRI